MSGRESKISILIHTHLNSSHETNFITRLQKNIHNSNDRKFSIAKPKIRKLVSEMSVHIWIGRIQNNIVSFHKSK
jgi:hypothetical protein